jgi:hypothetical protein
MGVAEMPGPYVHISAARHAAGCWPGASGHLGAADRLDRPVAVGCGVAGPAQMPIKYPTSPRWERLAVSFRVASRRASDPWELGVRPVI